MKILLISNMYPSADDPYFGAFINNIETGLIQSGANVDRIVIEGQGTTMFAKILKYFYFYKKIFQTDLSEYNFIHCSYPSHTIIPLLLKKYKSKLIIRFHGLEVVSDNDLDPLLPLRRFISKLAIIKADIVVVPSSYFKGIICKIATPKQIYTYPSGGVDQERFNRLPDAYIQDLDTKPLRIGYVGRLDVGKGVDTLLYALSKFNKPYKLTIVGKGPLDLSLKNLASKLKVNANFTGAIPNELLIRYYNNMDVLIFPTERKGESFGNVGIEAMSCGVPVIGSNFAGLLEYLINSYNGYTFEMSNPNSLLEVINKFNELSFLERSRLSNNALSTADKFSKKKLSDNFIDFLRKNNVT